MIHNCLTTIAPIISVFNRRKRPTNTSLVMNHQLLVKIDSRPLLSVQRQHRLHRRRQSGRPVRRRHHGELALIHTDQLLRQRLNHDRRQKRQPLQHHRPYSGRHSRDIKTSFQFSQHIPKKNRLHIRIPRFLGHHNFIKQRPLILTMKKLTTRTPKATLDMFWMIKMTMIILQIHRLPLQIWKWTILY